MLDINFLYIGHPQETKALSHQCQSKQYIHPKWKIKANQSCLASVTRGWTENLSVAFYKIKNLIVILLLFFYFSCISVKRPVKNSDIKKFSIELFSLFIHFVMLLFFYGCCFWLTSSIATKASNNFHISIELDKDKKLKTGQPHAKEWK